MSRRLWLKCGDRFRHADGGVYVVVALEYSMIGLRGPGGLRFANVRRIGKPGSAWTSIGKEV